jgi:hypothetical protein
VTPLNFQVDPEPLKEVLNGALNGWLIDSKYCNVEAVIDAAAHLPIGVTSSGPDVMSDTTFVHLLGRAFKFGGWPSAGRPSELEFGLCHRR